METFSALLAICVWNLPVSKSKSMTEKEILQAQLMAAKFDELTFLKTTKLQPGPV